MMHYVGPTRKETLLTLGLALFFTLFTAMLVGLRPEHFLLLVLFLSLYFGGLPTRKLAVALIPFVIFALSYDYMRVYPNYEVNPIDVEGIYQLEKSWFGIKNAAGEVVIPGVYFSAMHNVWADIFAGIFYLCWVPVPIAFGLYLYIKKERALYLRFAMTFLLVNLIGFAGYYIHPAAPPWYALNYGFEPILHTPGNVAGLGRFDELIGFGLFDSIYGRNANVFAAVPSLHSAYMLIPLYYALKRKSSKYLIALFSVILVGIWCTAVYSTHHYVIDVLLGIACALVGIILFDYVLMRIPAFKRFFNRYAAYIEKV